MIKKKMLSATFVTGFLRVKMAIRDCPTSVKTYLLPYLQILGLFERKVLLHCTLQQKVFCVFSEFFLFVCFFCAIYLMLMVDYDDGDLVFYIPFKII